MINTSTSGYMDSWSKLFIFVGIFFALVACSGGMDEQQLLKKAKAHLEEGELKAAVIELRNTLQQNAGNAEAQFLLGGIYKSIGDFTSAEKAFRSAAQAGWQEEEIQLKIAEVLLAQREFQKLLHEIQTSDTWSPSSRANLLALRAMAEAGLGDIERAETTLAQGTAIDSNAFQVLKSTAVLQLAEILSGDANDTLQAALAIYKDNVDLLFLQARAFLLQKESALAAESFRKIVQLDSSKPIFGTTRRATIGLARLHIANKEMEQARSILSPLLEDNAGDPEANYLSGLIAFEQGDYDVAADHISKTLKSAPKHLPSQHLMGRIKFGLKDYDQAAHYLSSYLKEAPEDLSARKLLVSAHIAQHQPQRARTGLEAILSEHPKDSGTLLLMSKLEFSEGNKEASISALRETVELDPGNPVLRKRLAIAYLNGGDLQQAIEQIEVYKQKTQDTQEADRILIAAYLKAGRHEEAIDIAQAMLAEDPKNPVVLSLNGSVYTASDKLQKARKFFEKALQLERGMLSASLGLARIESKEAHIDAAKAIYQDLAQSGKGGTVPMLALAELSAQQERQDEMLNWLEKARASAPDEIRARIIIANFYLNQGQTDKADAVIREAAGIAPENPEVMALQGKYLIAKKRYDEALLPLNKLVNEIPASAYARFLLGETYARLGMLSDAYEHFSNAIAIRPDLVAAIGLMAENELKQGNTSLSRSYATLLQRIRPDSYLGFKLEGDAWLTSKEYAKANDAFTTAWKKEEAASVAIGLFSAAKESGDFDSALQPILLWLKNNPGDTATRFFLATAYQNANQDKNAIREYKKVLDEEPGNAAALNNLAWLYFIHGDPRAIDIAEDAYQSTPDDPSIQDTYGWILVQQGQLDEGSRLLEQALEQLPDNQEIRYHVAAALLRSGSQEEGVLILEKLLDEEKPFAGRVQAERLLAEYHGAE